MITPRTCLAGLWGAIALFALYRGIVYRSASAWWLVVALVPPLIVFVWWMLDRAALERRISRLEARSEIGDERRVTAHTDLTKVEHKLHEIETRVAQVEDHEPGAPPSGLHHRGRIHEYSSSSVGRFISIAPK
jgi:hypothetical protein